MAEGREQVKREASLGRLLEGVLANLDLGSRLREQLAVRAWGEIAGRVVASHTRAEAVRDGVLMVAADTPAWANELHMRRGELLARLAGQVGEGVIRDIHFRAGVTRERQRKAAGEPVGGGPAKVKLSEQEEQGAREAAASIAAPELRERAERAFLALARMTRWRKEAGWRRCARCGQWQRTGKRWCASCLHGGQSGRRRQ